MNRKNVHDGPGLFLEQERHLERRIRRQRALFIPRFLTEAAGNIHLASPAQERAHQIAIRWAELESNGHLHRPDYKETSIDTQFLDQLFGDGLGYHVKTTSPDAWQLEHKFTVPGVGIADAALAEFPKSRVPIAVVNSRVRSSIWTATARMAGPAVQQCWDYLNALPGCAWGIVSNFTTIRLYHHEKVMLSPG
jgi:hypothetical protein